jgi:hypothetical protein
VKRFCAIPIAGIEGEIHQSSQRLLSVDGRGLSLERIFVSSAGLRDVSSLAKHLREREEASRVPRLERDGRLVGGQGVFGTSSDLV